MVQTATLSATLDWDLVLKALGFIVAAIVAYVQARGLYLASRTSLKTDLEILKLLDKGDRNYHIIKTAIDARIARLYEPRVPGNKRTIAQRWAKVAFGLVSSVGFSYWTFKLIQPGFTWWSLLTGYLALTSLGLALQSFLRFDAIRIGRWEIFLFPSRFGADRTNSMKDL